MAGASLRRRGLFLFLCILWVAALLWPAGRGAAHAQGDPHRPAGPVSFQTGAECMACHNGLTTPTGEDVSIGVSWRASMMAHSSRDPYWQGAVRREAIDHPEHAAAIEDECSICHMPMTTYPARAAGGLGKVFAHLPIGAPRYGSAGSRRRVVHRVPSDHKRAAGIARELHRRVRPQRRQSCRPAADVRAVRG